MNIEDLRDYCLSLPFVEEYTPFGPDTLCFRLRGKMFLLLNLDNHTDFVNMKCDAERAVELRERYYGIKPGWHMNKRLWNSVYFLSDVDDNLFLTLVRHAYNMVLLGLPHRVQAELELLLDDL